MKNILVVGGAGYIGGLTTNLLLAKNYNVTVFDNLTYEERFFKNVPFIFGDIRDTDLLLEIHKKFETIMWFAGIVGDGACQQDPELTYEVNFHSLKRFLDRAKRRVLFPSTCSVYGAQEGILTEKSEPHPLSAYAETKLLAEQAVLEHDGLVFRLGTLFGLGDEFSRMRLDLVVNVLTYKAVYENKITVFGGDQWRPILSVPDVAGYFVEAVTRDYNDVFNIAMRNVKILDLARTFENLFPGLKVEIVDMKFEDLRNYRVSTEKADSQFLFKPSVSVEAEICRMRDMLVAGRIKNPLDPRYYNTHYVKSALNEIRGLAKPARRTA